jgi:hypothetical protein
LKYLLILSLLLLVVGFLYWRLRPYIQMARRALGFVRDLRGVNLNAGTADLPRPKNNAAAGERLAPCAACGTWTPASRALSLRSSSSVYCSAACLERAADRPRRTGKSAS